STLRPTSETSRIEEWKNFQVGGKPQPDISIEWKRKQAVKEGSTQLSSDRDELLRRHLRSSAKGYDWFAHAMHGEPAGTPFILMSVFPELAPEIWGPPAERFSRFGLFD